MLKMRPLIVGIAGASCSGKSTLAKELFSRFGCRGRIVGMDIFAKPTLTYFPAEDPHHLSQQTEVNNNWLNWEEAESIDMARFIDDIKRAADEAAAIGDRVVLVEGFVLLEDSRVSDLIDAKIVLSIDREICFERRKSRGIDYLEQYLPEKELGLHNSFYGLSPSPIAQTYCDNSDETTEADGLLEGSSKSPRRRNWLRTYFDEVIWPFYQLYYERPDSHTNRAIENAPLILILDGMLGRDELANTAYDWVSSKFVEK